MSPIKENQTTNPLKVVFIYTLISFAISFTHELLFWRFDFEMIFREWNIFFVSNGVDLAIWLVSASVCLLLTDKLINLYSTKTILIKMGIYLLTSMIISFSLLYFIQKIYPSDQKIDHVRNFFRHFNTSVYQGCLLILIEIVMRNRSVSGNVN